ncbi:MAG: FAD-binding oxidoreductase [Chloroflexota bacterium]
MNGSRGIAPAVAAAEATSPTPPLRSGPRGSRPSPIEAAENATIIGREDMSPTVARFVVHPDGPIAAFIAGQYLALGLRVDGRIVQRPYSTAACPRTAQAHEFLVRRVPDGALTPHLWRAASGTRVRLGPPKGVFVLEPDDPRTHLLVSSGTGLAPFVSMVHALAGRGRPPRIVLVHGVSHAADLAERARLEAWARDGLVTYVPTISRPDEPANAKWRGRVGRTEAALADLCSDLALDPAATVAYLCGNPGMVDGAERLLRGRGFGDVRAERFWGPGATIPGATIPGARAAAA